MEKQYELNAQKLNRLTLGEKKALYQKAKDAYYNSQPIMSDKSFDLLEDDLKALVPSWSGLKRVGAPVKNVKKKVKLPIPMFSLNKTRGHNVDNWLAKQNPDAKVVVSLKADGASLEIIYEDGVPVQAITRGDGRIGGDVSYLIPHMRIPQKVGTSSFILRCEALFTTKAFSKYKEVFDAARNAASGLLNRQDVHEAVKDLLIVVLQVLRPNLPLSKGLAWAKSKGFSVIPYRVVPLSNLNGPKLLKVLTSQRTTSKFQIDGLVIALDGVNKIPVDGNPDWAVAFKAEMDGIVTTVTQVHWDVSHLGTLIPRIEYKPVDWEGSTLKFATAFNAKYIEDNHVGPGSKVEIVRSGDIIPYIKRVKVDKSRRPSMPPEEPAWHWDKNHVHILLDNPKENDDFRIKRLTKFFVAMEADFMREKTIRKLYDQGLTNLRKILAAPPEKFVGPGVSPQGAKRLYDAIHKVVDAKVPLTRLMVASSTFPRGMGQRRFQSIGERIDILKLAALDEKQQLNFIVEIPGWNTNTAQTFIKGLPRFLKWLELVGVPYTNDTGKPKTKKTVDGPLSGQAVSWTGYRNKDQEAAVEAAGGQVVPFGSRTTILLYSADGKASSKVDKAQAKGVKTMTWQQLSKKYGL